MSAPDYSPIPTGTFEGMASSPPGYSIVNPAMPTNVPLQPRAFPAPQQTAIVPYMAEIPGVPPGLEYLTQVDQVIIRGKFSSGQTWGRNYELLNVLNQRMFSAKQEPQFCGPMYNLNLTDNNNQEVIQLLQNCKCNCSSELEIHCPPGTIIGYSVWNWSAFVTSLSIQSATRQTGLVVLGPGFQQNIFGDVNFEVKSNDETQTVGMIGRESGKFTVQFPVDLDVKMKAALIGSSFYLWKDTSNASLLQERVKHTKRKEAYMKLTNKKQANESDNEDNQW